MTGFDDSHGVFSKTGHTPSEVWEEEEGGHLVDVQEGRLMQDANEMSYCRHSFRNSPIFARGKEVPRRCKDNLADDVCGEIIAFGVLVCWLQA
jgi:hypothetical protein